METKYNDNENRYLLLDSRNVPLAHVIMEGNPDSKFLTTRLMDDGAEEVLQHEIFRLLSMDKRRPLIQCHFVRMEGKRIILEQLSLLDPALRKDLRVPLHSESFLYFTDGNGSARCKIHFVDISCGGTAFYGPAGLDKCGSIEIVLPITTCPLVLMCQILNARELRNNRVLYAAKFLDLCNDEEKMIREAVFGLQLGNRSRNSHILTTKV